MHPNGKGFITTFRHPLMAGVTKTFGLGTRDSVMAEAVCHDAAALFNAEPLLQDPIPDKLRGGWVFLLGRVVSLSPVGRGWRFSAG